MSVGGERWDKLVERLTAAAGSLGVTPEDALEDMLDRWDTGELSDYTVSADKGVSDLLLSRLRQSEHGPRKVALVKRVARGGGVVKAATSVHLSPTTFYLWLESDPVFMEAMRAAGYKPRGKWVEE